jgi:hypothetical protein
MTQDTTGAAAPVAELEVPTTATTPADQAETAAPQDTQTEPSDDDKAKEQGRVARRMQQLLRDRWQERGMREATEREAAQLREELARMRATYGQDSSTAPPQPEQAQHYDPQVAYAHAAFDIKCNQIADQGAKAYPDFNDAMEAVRLSAPSQGALRTALAAVVEADEPAKVLHYLGTHPEEAEQLFRLSPVAMARKLGQIEARMSAPTQPPRTSSAPEPIKPIGARSSGPTGLSDSQSMADWIKTRNEQLARKQGRK